MEFIYQLNSSEMEELLFTQRALCAEKYGEEGHQYTPDNDLLIKNAQAANPEEYKVQLIAGCGIHVEEVGILNYHLPDGRKVTIGRLDIGFFRKLQALPAETKVSMMELSDQDLQDVLRKRSASMMVEAIKLLSTKWRWKETGEPYPADAISNGDTLGIFLSSKQIIARIKKGKYSNTQLLSMIDFFNSNKEVIE